MTGDVPSARAAALRLPSTLGLKASLRLTATLGLTASLGLTAALATAGCAPSAERGAGASSRPNLVVLVADDLGWDEVGWHDPQMHTPNLDRLAREGVVLDRFYVHPVCTPTRAAFLTGRHPARYGLGYSQLLAWSDRGIPPEETTLAEGLREAGYETALVGKWHLGHARRSFWPDRHGFAHFYGSLLGSMHYDRHTFAGGLDLQRDGRSTGEEGYITDLQAREAVRAIHGRDARRPLFLLVSFNAPHLPAQAPQELLRLFPNVANEGRRYFAAANASMDLAVGRILEALDEEGLRESTLILFFSDNGAPAPPADLEGHPARNAPLRGGKWTTFEGGIRVPAAVLWPGRLEGGRHVPEPVSILDVTPTLWAAAGVRDAASLPLDGRDVLPALRGAAPIPPRPIFLYSRHERDHYYTWIEEGWKVVRHDPAEGGASRAMLFHVAEDPEEDHDLAAQDPERLRAMLSRLDEAIVELPDHPDPTDFAQPEGWRPPRRWAEAARED